MTFGFFNGQPSSLHANSQVRVEILALWPAFPLSSVYMLMNGTKSNVTALTVKCYNCCLSRLSKEFQQPDCCLYNHTDHYKTHIGWAQLSSNAHKHLRNWEIHKSVPSATEVHLFQNCTCCVWLALSAGWDGLYLTSVSVCRGTYSILRLVNEDGSTLKRVFQKPACLIVWQPVEVAEECEGL